MIIRHEAASLGSPALERTETQTHLKLAEVRVPLRPSIPLIRSSKPMLRRTLHHVSISVIGHPG